jgi:hypothetical protein
MPALRLVPDCRPVGAFIAAETKVPDCCHSVGGAGGMPVTRAEGCSLSQRYRTPPSAPPINGASQNSQSWARAQPPANKAGPVLLAGLTERFVIGMPTRWISVKPSPIAIGAKPTGALPCVEPMMMKRNIIVRMISAKSHENRL